jgi:hypothetical protein
MVWTARGGLAACCRACAHPQSTRCNLTQLPTGLLALTRLAVEDIRCYVGKSDCYKQTDHHQMGTLALAAS